MKTKQAQTNLAKYGFENVACSIEVQNKMKETCQTRYGADSPLESILIQNKIKLTLKSIGARQCNAGEVSFADASAFLDLNHIQGTSYGCKEIGAYYNNELCGILTYTIKNNILDITRFATSIGITFPGLFSKMIKFLVALEKPTTLITFSDNRYSNGNLYKQVGFQIDHIIKPDYYYTDYKHTYHKMGFRKKALAKKVGIDVSLIASLTEWEIMQHLGYDRIWDCGKIKWIMKL